LRENFRGNTGRGRWLDPRAVFVGSVIEIRALRNPEIPFGVKGEKLSRLNFNGGKYFLQR
jgi:hypothetical protein